MSGEVQQAVLTVGSAIGEHFGDVSDERDVDGDQSEGGGECDVDQ